MIEYYDLDNQEELTEFCNDKKINVIIREIKNPVTLCFNGEEIIAIYSQNIMNPPPIDYTEYIKLKKLQEILS